MYGGTMLHVLLQYIKAITKVLFLVLLYLIHGILAYYELVFWSSALIFTSFLFSGDYALLL